MTGEKREDKMRQAREAELQDPAVRAVLEEMNESHLEAVKASGWRLGLDPHGEVPVPVFVHDDQERVWPVDDPRGAVLDVGDAWPGDADPDP